MIFKRRKPVKLLITAGSMLISIALLSACGGSSSDSTDVAGIGGTGIGIGGTGIVSGKITGFGSVYVNGGKFDIDTSQFNVDGDTGADQGDLALGMVITLEVEIENDIQTGKALKVFYDDEVEGPIAPVPGVVVGANPTQKTFKIFNQVITIDETSTLFDGTSFATIVANDIIEISGFRVSPTEIKATYVEKTGVLVPGVSEVELRGSIDQYMGGSTFEINGTVINFDPTGVATEIDVPGGVVSNGLYVEVEGVIQADLSVTADQIEEEDEDFDDDAEDISLQGVISNYVSDSNFEIDGQQIDASGAQFSPASISLDDGLEVEVEGDIVSGVLIAEEIELREGETKLKTFVSLVYPDNIRFEVNYTGLPGSIVVNTDSQTLLKDEGPLELPNFSVADLNVGDYVIVEGIESADEVIAETVKRKDSADPDDSELEGQVDSFVIDTSITVLGITYNVDAGTDYEDANGATVSSAEFFGQLAPGDLVEIKDEEIADGTAEEVEIE